MKNLRVISALAIVISTSLLLGILAFDKLSNSDNESLEFIFLQTIHISFLIGSIVFTIHHIQQKQLLQVILTLLPIGLFLLAFLGMLSGFRATNLSLLLFDFYLIFYFFYLFLIETVGFNRAL
jgi:hypothetical protein